MISLKIFNIIAIFLLNSSLQTFGFQQGIRCPFAELNDYPYDLSHASSSTSAVVTSPLSKAGTENLLNIPRNAITLKPVPAPGFSGDSISAWLQQFFNNEKQGPYNNQISNANAITTEVSAYQNFFDTPEISKVQCAAPPLDCSKVRNNIYYRSYDGSCNNLQYPSYGMAKARYVRFLLPKYGDGVYTPTLSVTGKPLPNSRLLSLVLYGEQTNADSFRTIASLNWGQLVAHDLSQLSTQGAPEDCCINITNKKCYPISLHPFGPITTGSRKSCLHFARSISDADANCPKSGLPYSEKITVSTAYLDLSSIYGNSLEQNHKVRQYQGGLLKTSRIYNKQWLPITSNNNGDCRADNYQCFSIPDKRNQLTPTLAVLHTIMLREHNRIATALKSLNPHFNDERIFQETRKLNIAQYQKITFYDWLPRIIGPDYAYAHNLIYHVQPNEYVHDYDVRVNAAPYAAFASSAFRYSHNQIPGWFSLVSPNHQYNQTLRLSDYIDRSENVNFIAENFDAILRGLAQQRQKRADGNIDKEIKHFFDRKDFEQFGADLKSFDIQRGRDFGLSSYNDYRQFCGLPRALDWSMFAHEIQQEKIALMQQLYESPDDVELNVGGSLEFHAPNSNLGPTFQCLIGRQFLKTRTGDRFFFERENRLSGFNREQLIEIRKVSLSGLFCNNADYLRSIQSNVFILPSISNALRSCKSIPQLDLNKWKDVPQQTLY